MATLTTNINYLQPTGYKLTIDRENYPNLEFFAQNVQHPDLTLVPSELQFRKVRSIPMPGGTLDYGELSANIILDEDMKAYTEMHDWMRRLLDAPLKGALDRNSTSAASTDTIPSTADITLTILNSMNNKVKNIRYQDAMPTNLGAINFESTSSGTEFITFPVSFRYSIFELV